MAAWLHARRVASSANACPGVGSNFTCTPSFMTSDRSATGTCVTALYPTITALSDVTDNRWTFASGHERPPATAPPERQVPVGMTQ